MAKQEKAQNKQAQPNKKDKGAKVAEVEKVVETFVEEIPYYNQRSVVKPGISGYAQVMYTYGTGVKDARHKLMYDLYYITNWSLTLELTIVWRTLVTVLLSRGI